MRIFGALSAILALSAVGVGQNVNVFDLATDGSIQALPTTTHPSTQNSLPPATDTKESSMTTPAATAAEGKADQKAECSAAGVEDWNRNLQIGGVFIILAVSSLGVMVPVGCKYIRWLNMDRRILNAGKFFGAGVIMATAFIHMLGESMEALKDDCLDG
ncbi:hypothetical protein EV175_006120, partial [Coemansia sp. RSA 1933]